MFDSLALVVYLRIFSSKRRRELNQKASNEMWRRSHFPLYFSLPKKDRLAYMLFTHAYYML